MAVSIYSFRYSWHVSMLIDYSNFYESLLKVNSTNSPIYLSYGGISSHKTDKQPQPDFHLDSPWFQPKRITIPFFEEGFEYGLKFIELNKTGAEYSYHPQNYSHFSNNCADSVYAMISGGFNNIPKLEPTSEFASILNSSKDSTKLWFGTRNPNLSWFGTSTIDFAHRVRKQVYKSTLKNAYMPYEDKVLQILKIEQMRLDDDIYNYQGSIFRFLYSHQINIKREKLQCLKTLETNISELLKAEIGTPEIQKKIDLTNTAQEQKEIIEQQRQKVKLESLILNKIKSSVDQNRTVLNKGCCFFKSTKTSRHLNGLIDQGKEFEDQHKINNSSNPALTHIKI